jgi:hypothetical protein
VRHIKSLAPFFTVDYSGYTGGANNKEALENETTTGKVGG